MNSAPNRSAFDMAEWDRHIRQNIEALFADEKISYSLDPLFYLVCYALNFLSPFLGASDDGWYRVEKPGTTLRVTLATPLFFPQPSLQLPAVSDSDSEKGILFTLRQCLYKTALLGNTPGYVPNLSDGLFLFGILCGTGYYWSLSDHRNRLTYGKHPHTFDELSGVIPSLEEEALQNLKLVYDNNELSLPFCLRFSQEENKSWN